MDPALFQSTLGGQQSAPATSDDVDSAVTATQPLPATDDDPSAMDSAYDMGGGMDDDSDTPGIDGVKRPRLRLAHACDRCRKRKIRCDTQQPCGPCSATKNECTFNTPSRRVAKPKVPEGRSSSAGVKRPHSPPRGSGGGSGGSGSGSSAYQASLEARLATLESLLRDVPPNVHNAYLSTLDARLGAGQGAGLAQGKGDGVGISSEALGASPALGGGIVGAAAAGATPLAAFVNPATAPTWTAPASMAGAWAGGRTMSRRRDHDRSVDAVARRMENLSFFYEDEIGQAKWQGECVRRSLLWCILGARQQDDAARRVVWFFALL